MSASNARRDSLACLFTVAGMPVHAGDISDIHPHSNIRIGRDDFVSGRFFFKKPSSSRSR